jgi:hypothetical protein
VILDDANIQIYYAQLVEEESTMTVLAALREEVQNHGLFCALYPTLAHPLLISPGAQPIQTCSPDFLAGLKRKPSRLVSTTSTL